LYLVLRLPTAALPRMEFRRERGLDRFGKTVGLNRELQTGNAEFDAAVYIESDASAEAVKPFLDQPQLRAAVLEGVKTLGVLRFVPEGIEVSYWVERVKKEKPLVDKAVAALAAI